MGSMACLLVLLNLPPNPASLAGYASMRGAMAQIIAWIFLPSLVATLIAGLLAIAVNRAFHDAGWAWVKAATGILIFAGGFHAMSPIQEEAQRSAHALAGQLDGTKSPAPVEGEQGTLWVLLAVSAANVALGVWRPRVVRVPSGRTSRGSFSAHSPRYWRPPLV
jgi:hypothetical protein